MHYTGQPCPKCGLVASPPNGEDFTSFFLGEKWACNSCRHSETLWTRLLQAMHDSGPFAAGIIALGLAEAKFLSIELQRDAPILLDLTQRGVPHDATILDLFLTPISGGSEPSAIVPVLGIQRLSQQHVPHSFLVYPMKSLCEGDATGSSNANLMVIWLPPAIEPELVPLASAAHAFGMGDYRNVIVPANVAVEDKLNKVLGAHYAQYASASNVKNFLGQGVSFGHQLRFLLPSLFSMAEAPALDKSIADRLRRLQKLRNEVAHGHKKVERDTAAELLLAALFGYRYLSEFGDRITGRAGRVSVDGLTPGNE